MNKLILVAAGIVLALMASCTGKAPVPPDKKDYVGHWTGSNGSTITISEDGGCNYEQKKSGSSSKMEGGGVHWDGNTLICKLGVSAKFAIDQPPAQSGGKWTMKLDGETYTKQ